MFNKIIGGQIMRKLIYVIVLSLGCGSLFAHIGSITNSYSDLNIKMWDNSSFIINLDHDISERTRSFSLKNVSPGNHYVKIVKKKRNHNGYGGFVQTIYEGRINIPSKRKVFVKVEGRNKLSFKFFRKQNQLHNNGHGHHHNNGHGNHNNNYGSGNYSNNWDYGCEPINVNDGYYGQLQASNNGFTNNYGPVVMNNNSFNILMDVLRNENFDNARLGIAKQALASNRMNVKQVAAIMDLLTFDNAKLSFAKAAYNKTVDRENYFVINGKFSFSSSVSDLNNYIRHNS